MHVIVRALQVKDCFMWPSDCDCASTGSQIVICMKCDRHCDSASNWGGGPQVTRTWIRAFNSGNCSQRLISSTRLSRWHGLIYTTNFTVMCFLAHLSSWVSFCLLFSTEESVWIDPCAVSVGQVQANISFGLQGQAGDRVDYGALSLIMYPEKRSFVFGIGDKLTGVDILQTLW